MAVIEQRLPDVDKLLVPSVLEELAFLCELGQSQRVRTSAQGVFSLLRKGETFRFIVELPIGSDVVDEVAAALRSRGLLPAEEVHDALILAEAAVLDCGLLLTSDEHLCGIDHERLSLLLNPYDLTPPVLASPREIVRKFFR